MYRKNYRGPATSITATDNVKYRAKFNRILSTIEWFYDFKKHNVVRDSKDAYIEVDTAEEAEVIEALNRLEEERNYLIIKLQSLLNVKKFWVMAKSQFDVQFARVGRFIKRHSARFPSAMVRVFSDCIRVDFRTADVVREIPDGSDEVIMFADGGFIVIRCCFYYEEEKEGLVMNVLITLPKHLIDCIIRGEKTYEMRKTLPKLMELGRDGFFAVEKGTSNVRCWCRIDSFYYTRIDYYTRPLYVSRLCVNEEYIKRYAGDKKVYVWKIGKVIEVSDLDRSSLFVDRNPQQFAYCPLSYGESY